MLGQLTRNDGRQQRRPRRSLLPWSGRARDLPRPGQQRHLVKDNVVYKNDASFYQAGGANVVKNNVFALATFGQLWAAAPRPSRTTSSSSTTETSSSEHRRLDRERQPLPRCSRCERLDSRAGWRWATTLARSPPTLCSRPPRPEISLSCRVRRGWRSGSTRSTRRAWASATRSVLA